MPDSNLIEKTINDYFAAIRSGDVDAWVGTFTETAISHDPMGTPPHRGHAGLRQFFQNLHSAFRKVELYEEDPFIAGSGAAVKWRGEGIGTDGTQVSFEGIDIFEMNDEGKITSHRAYWDPRAVLAKLEGE